MFFGTYTHTLDDAGRLTIPVKLREAIAASEKSPHIFFTLSAEKCIVGYTETRVAEMLADMRQNGVGRDQMREFKRIFGGEGAMESWDKQGRVLLSDGLKAHAGIARDVTIVGAVDCFEIWDTQTYNSRREEAKIVYELVAGKVIQ